jgi:hypothetical protein
MIYKNHVCLHSQKNSHMLKNNLNKSTFQLELTQKNLISHSPNLKKHIISIFQFFQWNGDNIGHFQWLL